MVIICKYMGKINYIIVGDGITMYSIGEFIRSKRLELNITMNELADKISTSQSAVSLIENDRRIPSIDTLK